MFKDLTGQRFGLLTVIERGDNIRGRPGWICKCDCGNVKLISSVNLRNGTTRSCGCSRKNRAMPKWAEDLVGRKFGGLIVLERGENVYVGKDKQERVAWWCACENCGTVKLVQGAHLKSGRVTSCGNSECRTFVRAKKESVAPTEHKALRTAPKESSDADLLSQVATPSVEIPKDQRRRMQLQASCKRYWAKHKDEINAKRREKYAREKRKGN